MAYLLIASGVDDAAERVRLGCQARGHGEAAEMTERALSRIDRGRFNVGGCGHPAGDSESRSADQAPPSLPYANAGSAG